MTLNNNPKIFTKYDSTFNKILPNNVPRSWIPVKNNAQTSVISHVTPNMPGKTRMHTKFPPVSYTKVRTSIPETNGKMASFRHKIPITYPTGKHVLPPPTNLPIFPASIPSETPKNFQAQLFHVRDKGGNKLSLEKLLQDPISSKNWFPSTENELGRLAQGFKGRVKAQDAMNFIYKPKVPSHKIVTYANFVCDYRSLKSEPF